MDSVVTVNEEEILRDYRELEPSTRGEAGCKRGTQNLEGNALLNINLPSQHAKIRPRYLEEVEHHVRE
jgi:hypothetical protein